LRYIILSINVVTYNSYPDFIELGGTGLAFIRRVCDETYRFMKHALHEEGIRFLSCQAKETNGSAAGGFLRCEGIVWRSRGKSC